MAVERINKVEYIQIRDTELTKKDMDRIVREVYSEFNGERVLVTVRFEDGESSMGFDIDTPKTEYGVNIVYASFSDDDWYWSDLDWLHGED